MLFSNYPRRCSDFLEEAKRVFSVMEILSAKYYVLHGAPAGAVKPEIYFERFALLAKTGKEFGVTVTQENVNKYEGQSLRFLREFCRSLGDTAKLTFDVKQAVRAGVNIEEAVRTVGKHIVNVHLSDHGAAGDCLRIGKGKLQTADFLRSLHMQGYDGAVTLELYRSGFEQVNDLAEDYQRIGRLIKVAEAS